MQLVDVGGRGTAAATVEIKLFELERIFYESGTVTVRVALNARVKSGDGKVFIDQRFEQSRDTENDSVAASVRAINRALGQIYLQVADAIAASMG